MDMLFSLWLPILISGVVVFFASFVMWMVMPHHKSDYAPLPDEDGLMASLGDSPAGMYMWPFCTTKDEWKDPEWIKKSSAGPSGWMVVRPRGPWNMGTSMGQSFTANLIIAICTAYVATIGLAAGAPGADVFRMTATVTFLAYAGASGYELVWMAKPGRIVLKNIADSLLYGLATGAIFMWLWPAA